MIFVEYIKAIFKKNPYFQRVLPEEWERKKWDTFSKIIIWSVPIILGYLSFSEDGFRGFFFGNVCGWWITFWVFKWEEEKQKEKQRHIEYLKMGYKDYLDKLLNDFDDEIKGQEDIKDLSPLWDGLTPESKIEIARDGGLSVSEVEPDRSWVNLSQEAKDALSEELTNIFFQKRNDLEK